ncbi:MAG TPA: cyclodeaminase/cyclohydrolase family protein [Bryobacteraceae bacterium]|nr:cyclodeaminase/cyclohydrolase family protein [Bryobacteraceae bacterium]
MESPIGSATIESFRKHIAGANDPIAGGVAVASVSASLGMALLALTLKVACQRKDFAGDRTQLTKLHAAVQKESAHLVRYADQDIAAYQQYRDSLKRKRGVDTALRGIIQTPLEAASSAARGLDFCAEAVSLVPSSVVSDLGAASTLLAGSVKAILLTVDVNLRQLPTASELRLKAGKTRRALETRSRKVEQVLKQVGDLLHSR